MAYAPGQLIENEHYNQFLNDVKEIINDLHKGEINQNPANYGYGQVFLLTEKNDQDLVTAKDWDDLITLVKNITYIQDVTSLPHSIASLNIETGNIIDVISDLATHISDLKTNRLTISDVYTTITNNGQSLKDVRLGGFVSAPGNNTTVRHEFTAKFENWDHMRYFFNAGGQIRFSPKFATNSYSQVNQDWVTLFSKINFVSMGHTDTTRDGAAYSSLGIGFYDLTDSFSTIYSDTHANLVMTIKCKLSGVVDVITQPAELNFQLEIVNNNTNPALANGKITSLIDLRYANSSLIAVQPPTFVTTLTMNQSLKPVYSSPKITITDGSIKSLSIVSAGSSYTLDPEEVVLDIVGGSGQSAKIEVKSVNNTGGITSFQIIEGGLSYLKNEIVSVSSGTATFKITSTNSVTGSNERQRHYDRLEQPTKYIAAIDNFEYMDFYDVQAYDPEYVLAEVNGEIKKFKYLYDSETNKEKLVVQTKSGKATFYRGTTPNQRISNNRECIIDFLDVQDGSTPFKFTYVMETYNDETLSYNFSYDVDDTMFSWDSPTFIGDKCGSPENNSFFISQSFYGSHAVCLDRNGLYYVVGGAGKDGVYLSKHDRDDGSLETTFGTNGKVIIPLGEYGGGVITKIINTREPSTHEYAVIGYVIYQGNRRGFIALVKSNGELYNIFGNSGVYIEPSDNGPTIYYDIEINQSSATILKPNEYVVLSSRLRENNSLYVQTFNSTTKTESNRPVYTAGEFGDIDDAKLFKQQNNLGVCFNVNNVAGVESVIITDLGSFYNDNNGDKFQKITENKTSKKLDIVETQEGDATIYYAPYAVKTDVYDGVLSFPTVRHSYHNGKLLIAQPYSIGNINSRSYGIKLQRFIYNDGIYVIDQTFANEYNSNNIWLSHVDKNAVSVPPKDLKQYIPRSILTDASETIYIIGSYLDTNEYPSYNQHIRMFIMTVDKDGNNAPSLKVLENQWNSNALDAILHSHVDSTNTLREYLVTTGILKNIDAGNLTQEGASDVNRGLFVNKTRTDLSTEEFEVYIDTTTSESLQQLIITANDGSQMGSSVALSSDGLAVVGEKNKNGGVGQVTVYKKDETGQYNVMQVLPTPITLTGNANFGHCVSMSDSGKHIIVGAPNCTVNSNIGAGRVYLYIFDQTLQTWSEFAYAQSSSIDANNNFGYSCDISGDGKWFIVGSPNEKIGASSYGRAYYGKITGTNENVVSSYNYVSGDPSLTLGISDVNRRFGDSVKISSKNYQYPDYCGYTFIVSKPTQTIQSISNVGAIDVFSNLGNSEVYTFMKTMSVSVPYQDANFGSCVELDDYGITIFSSQVMNPNVANSQTFVVNAYEHEIKNNTLSLVRTHSIESISVPDEVISISCGHDGRTLAIGAKTVYSSDDPDTIYDDVNNTNQVYVYHRVGKDDPNKVIGNAFDEIYVHQTTLTTPSKYSPADSAAGFGVVDVSTNNNVIIVGAPENTYGDDSTNTIGKVYFYVASDKKVEFNIAGEETVVENNIEQYINNASGQISITKNLKELDYEILTLAGETLTISNSDQYLVHEFKVGYFVVSKTSSSTREWKFYPKWGRYNFSEGGETKVSVEFQYSTVSKNKSNMTKSFTIQIEDGNNQQISSFVPSLVYNTDGLYVDPVDGRSYTLDYSYSGYLKYNEFSDRLAFTQMTITAEDSVANFIESTTVDVYGSTQPQRASSGFVDVIIDPTLNNVDNLYTFSFVATGSGIETKTTLYDGKSQSMYLLPDGEIAYIQSGSGFFAPDGSLVNDDSMTYYKIVVYGTHNRDAIDKILVEGQFVAVDNGNNSFISNTSTTLKLNDNYQGYRNSSFYSKYIDDVQYRLDRIKVGDDTLRNTTVYTFYVENNTDRMVAGNEYKFKVYLNQNVGKLIAGSYKLDDKISGVSSTNITYINGALAARSLTSPASIKDTYCAGDCFPKINGKEYDLYFTPYTDGSGKKPKITFALRGTHSRDAISQINIFGEFGRGTDYDSGFREVIKTDPTNTEIMYGTYLQLFTNGETKSKSSTSVYDEVGVLTPKVKCFADLYPVCSKFETVDGVTKWEWEGSEGITDGPFVIGKKYDIVAKRAANVINVNNVTSYNFGSKRGYISYYNEHGVYVDDVNNVSNIDVRGYNNIDLDSVYTADGTTTSNPKITIELKGKLPKEFLNNISISGSFVTGSSNIDFVNHTYELSVLNNDVDPESVDVYVPYFSTFQHKKVRDSLNGKESENYTTVWEWEYVVGQNDQRSTGTFINGNSYSVIFNGGEKTELSIENAKKQVTTGGNVYSYNITAGGDNLAYYGYVGDNYLDKPNIIGSATSQSMLIGDAKIMSFTSSPTINYYFGTMYGQVVYELQVEGNQPIDLFKTLTVMPANELSKAQPKVFGASFNRSKNDQPLQLNTNVIVGKYSGGKYYGKRLDFPLTRRKFNSIYPPNRTQLVDPKNMSNKYGWDDSAIVKVLATGDEVHDVFFLYESNKPYLHDFYQYEKEGVIKTVWQWIVGAPIYSHTPIDYNANTVVPGRSLVSGRQYALSIDAPTVTSEVDYIAKTYINSSSIVDSIKYDKNEIYRTFTIAPKATDYTFKHPVRQDVNTLNISTIKDGDLYHWAENVGDIDGSNVLSSEKSLKIESLTLNQQSGKLSVKFSTTDKALNLLGVIDRIQLTHSSTQVYNGRLPTMPIDQVTEGDDYYVYEISNNIRFLTVVVTIEDWVNITSRYFQLTIVSNKNGIKTQNPKYVMTDNTKDTLKHDGKIKVSVLSRQTDEDIISSTEVSSVVKIKNYVYDTLVYKILKVAAYYGLGPTVSSYIMTPPSPPSIGYPTTPHKRPSTWVRQSWLEKQLPYTNGNQVYCDIQMYEVNKKGARIIPSKNKSGEYVYPESVTQAHCVVDGDNIIAYDTRTAATKTKGAIDIDTDFRYRRGSYDSDTHNGKYYTDASKGSKRIIRTIFSLFKQWK